MRPQDTIAIQKGHSDGKLEMKFRATGVKSLTVVGKNRNQKFVGVAACC
jgi:hypothetical protein